MQYLGQEGKVDYTSKDGRARKSFPALEWLANLCSHMLNRGEPMVQHHLLTTNTTGDYRISNETIEYGMKHPKA